MSTGGLAQPDVSPCILPNVLLVVEPLDDVAVLLQHGVSLELERGAQLAGGHAEVAGDDGELLNPLRV